MDLIVLIVIFATIFLFMFFLIRHYKKKKRIIDSFSNRVAGKLCDISSLIITLGIVISWFMGAVFPSISYDYSSISGYTIEETYNLGLAIAGCIVSYIVGMTFIGFSEIIELLSRNNNKQDMIIKYLKKQTDSCNKQKSEDVEEILLNFEKLLDEGLITEEIFEAKKKELLG